MGRVNDNVPLFQSVHLAELDSRRDQIYAALDSARCQPQGSCSAFNTNQFRSPTILWCKKIGQPFQSQRNTLRRQTLINLSYSQPSSPKTPLQKRTYLVAATPLMKMPASRYVSCQIILKIKTRLNVLFKTNGFLLFNAWYRTSLYLQQLFTNPTILITYPTVICIIIMLCYQ